jgi:hypothetical protein
VENNTHFFVLGDIFQIIVEEFGGHDAAVLRARDGMKEAIQKYGVVYLDAHSQGTMTDYQAFLMLSLAERSRVHYEGKGGQMYVDKEKLGLAEAINIRYPKDPVPIMNDVLKYVGMRPWHQVWTGLERQRDTEDTFGHNYLVNYLNGKRKEDGK